jgi:membrane protein YdbS with pleckstrin-like domain
VVYWLEAALVTPLAVLRVATARQVELPTAGDRYGVALDGRYGSASLWSIPVRPRNTRYAAGLTLFWVVWLGGGLFTLAQVTSPTVEPAIVGATAGLVPLHLVETRRVLAGGYESRTPSECVHALTMNMFVVSSGLFLVAGDVQTPEPVVLALTAVSVKTALELSSRGYVWPRPTRRVEQDPSTFVPEQSLAEVFSPFSRAPRFVATPERVAAPETAPRAVVRPSVLGLVARAPSQGARTIQGTRALGGLVAALAIQVLWIVLSPGDWRVALLLMLVAVVFFGGIITLSGLGRTVTRHGTVEFRFHNEQLVCHDGLTDEPQWTLPYEDIESVTQRQRLTDRLVSTGTVRIETSNGATAVLFALRNPETVCAALDTPTDLSRLRIAGSGEELNRTVRPEQW